MFSLSYSISLFIRQYCDLHQSAPQHYNQAKIALLYVNQKTFLLFLTDSLWIWLLWQEYNSTQVKKQVGILGRAFLAPVPIDLGRKMGRKWPRCDWILVFCGKNGRPRASFAYFSTEVSFPNLGWLRSVTKKGSLTTSFFRVPSGIRTHDIQNHNLTL